MSAAGNVEQKPKPQRSQAQNGPVNPKEVSSETNFERYMPSNQVSQGYPGAPTNMAPGDTYMASYYPSTYSFPYSMPGSETTWSTGSDNFNSNYNDYFSYQAQDYYNQPGTTPPYLGQSFNFFPGNADYTQGSWGGQGQTGTHAPTGPSSYYDYSRYPGAQAGANMPRPYQGVNGYEVQDGKAHGMKAVEQGVSVLHISSATDKGPGGSAATNGKVDPRIGQAGGAPSFSQAAAGGGGGAPSGGNKPTSWAAIASKPAKPQPKVKSKTGSHAPVPTQLPSMKQPMAIGTWNAGDKPVGKVEAQGQPPQTAQPPNGNYAPQGTPPQNAPPVQAVPPQPVVKPEELPTPQQASQISQGKQGFSSSEQSGRSQPQAVVQPQPQQPNRWGSSQHHHERSGKSNYSSRPNNARNSGNSGGYSSSSSSSTSVVLEKLRSSNEYNPSELALELKNARFFIIKSYSEDDIHRSIKYGIWCSTEHGNKRLDSAFKDKKSDKSGGSIYLLFSVNGSGHFCGIAEMMSAVDYNTNTGVWAQDKWKGRFDVKWIYVKDVPNNQLRHIRLENNENKPVTNSRDTQEVPQDKARAVVKIIHSYVHTTSIFDDFNHYEKRQEEDSQRKTRPSRGGHRN